MRKTTSITLSKSDFDEFEYCVVMFNSTTKTAVYDSDKMRVSEFTDNGLVMRVAGKPCALGHILLLHFFPGRGSVRLSNPPTKVELKGAVSVTAKVVEMEWEAGSEAAIKVEFYQLAGERWKKFRNIFGVLQKKVDRIVKRIKE